jgi:hypothetical protein
MEEMLCADGAIATSDFIFFLELLHRKNHNQPYALFLDNLKVHTSKDSTKAM